MGPGCGRCAYVEKVLCNHLSVLVVVSCAEVHEQYFMSPCPFPNPNTSNMPYMYDKMAEVSLLQ